MKAADLRLIAKHYYNLGINVTCICNYRNKFNLLDRNLLKAPSHDWEKFSQRRQPLKEFASLDWDNCIGVGAVLGYNDLMALDIDGCIEWDFIKLICKVLGIDTNYEWIVQSGSGAGYHLIFYCHDRLKRDAKQEIYSISNKAPLSYENDKIDAFYPKRKSWYSAYGVRDNPKYNEFRDIFDVSSKFGLVDLFQKIEFRWSNHLVLPNSIHESGQSYSFLTTLPFNPPIEISFEKLCLLHDLICSTSADFSGWEGTADNNVAYQDQLFINQAAFKFKAKYRPQYLVFDLKVNDGNETTNYQTEIVHFAWLIVDYYDNIINHASFILRPDGYLLKEEGKRIHGITDEIANLIGVDFKTFFRSFLKELETVEYLVCLNYEFTTKVLVYNLEKFGLNSSYLLSKQHKDIVMSLDYEDKPKFFIEDDDTEEIEDTRINLCKLYNSLFDRHIQSLNNAVYDSIITKICYVNLKNSKSYYNG